METELEISWSQMLKSIGQLTLERDVLQGWFKKMISPSLKCIQTDNSLSIGRQWGLLVWFARKFTISLGKSLHR